LDFGNYLFTKYLIFKGVHELSASWRIGWYLWFDYWNLKKRRSSLTAWII